MADLCPYQMLYPAQQFGVACSIVAEILMLLFAGSSQQADIYSVFADINANPDGGQPCC